MISLKCRRISDNNSIVLAPDTYESETARTILDELTPEEHHPKTFLVDATLIRHDLKSAKRELYTLMSL